MPVITAEITTLQPLVQLAIASSLRIYSEKSKVFIITFRFVCVILRRCFF
ncbi:hypothetical protein [Calothrix sp. UHCC 0171]|nr:hypothetical protein [Calothrix sp. UHCC 0171]MEA5571380.1 hypothetical protein [Calothrix sp. UHCC 0171]